MAMIQSSAKVDSKFLKVFVITAVVIFGIVMFWGLLASTSRAPEAESSAGLFGDSFGAINALFTGMALAGVIATLIAQRDELKMQREDLELTRRDIKDTLKEHQKAAKAQAQQVEIMRLNGLAAGRAAVAQALSSQRNRGDTVTELQRAGMESEAQSVGQALIELLKVLRALEKAGENNSEKREEQEC